MENKLYLYELLDNNTPEAYDEAMAVACMQGLYNRTGAHVYVTTPDSDKRRNGVLGEALWGTELNRPVCTPKYWLNTFTSPGGWLHGREQVVLHGLNELYQLTRSHIKGAVIWDPAVPATINAATTIAGVEDLIVFSPELYRSFGETFQIPIVHDLRGRFDGSETGSARNDVYRWAIREYIDTGKCSTKLVGQYQDAWLTREKGYLSYVTERDRLIAERAFAFDLSVWGHYPPLSDPSQPVGTDRVTFEMVLEHVSRQANGKNMTEFCGFFNGRALNEGQPNGVLTEWEQVFQMSKYCFYQNTAANDVLNQSFHRWAPFEPLKQHRPAQKRELENKVYLCIQVCDMDSTTPLYDVMPVLWDDPRRGEYPLAWGINPNLYGVLPDVMKHYYDTASENDYFCADAGAAGYFNACNIPSKDWDMVVDHNKYWFDKTDMTIAGMVLDCDNPSEEVLRNYSKFAPDGFASLVCAGIHPTKNPALRTQVYNGMPVGFMTHGVCDWLGSVQATCKGLNDLYFCKFSSSEAHFIYYRICYRSPSEMFDLYEELKKTNPHLDIELVDPYTYFSLLKEKVYADARECDEDIF